MQEGGTVDHRRLVADLGKHLGTTEEVIFTGALRRKTGVMTGMNTERALEDLGKFRRTGEAPSYVELYALYYLGSIPNKRKAVRTRELLGGIQPHVAEPQASLVSSLFDSDTA